MQPLKLGPASSRDSGRDPAGGPSWLLPECRVAISWSQSGRPPTVNFHPQRATAEGHVIMANMAAAAAGS